MAEQYEVKAVYSADITAFSAGVQTAIASMSNFNRTAKDSTSNVYNSLKSVGKAMTVVGAATTAVGMKSIKSFGDFQQSLNQAAVIAGGTAKDIGGLSDMANKMGADLPLSAKNAADAMVAMARDGASISTIKEEFPSIARAATAAGEDLQTTAGVVQQSMNIWGKSLDGSSQAAAILTQTANLSNASIGSMQQALATIGGTASNAGVSMQDTSTAIGLLTNRGFSAAQASQDLNHAMLMMQAPSSVAAKQMDALGISFTDAQGNMKQFPQILTEISQKMDGMSSSDKAAALKKMFGTSGMGAILPLLDSINDKSGNTTTSWNAFSDAMQQASANGQVSTDFLKNQATEMQKNIGSKIEQLGGNWEQLRNKSLESKGGVSAAFIDMTNGALNWASASNDPFAKMTQNFIGLTPVIGPAVTATGGFLVNVGKIGSAVSGVAKVMTGMTKSIIKVISKMLGLGGANTTVAATSAPAAAGTKAVGGAAKTSAKDMVQMGLAVMEVGAGIALATIGIAALVLSIAQLAKTGTAGAIALAGITVSIAAMVAVFALFGPALNVALPGMIGLAAATLSFGAAILMAGTGIAIATTGISLLVNSISQLIDTLNNANQAGENAKQLLVSIGEGFAGMIAQFLISLEEAVPQVVQGFIDMLVSVFNIIATNAPTVVGAFTDMIVSLINAISDNLGNILDAGTNLVINLLKGIGTKTNEVINAGVDMVKSILQGITDNLHKLSDTAVDFVNRLVYEIGYAAGRLWGSGSQLLDTVVKGFKDGQNKAKNAGTNASNSVHDGVSSVDLWGAGNAIIDGFVKGLRDAWEAGKSFVSGIASWIKKHKGPISYDKVLLTPAGNAIMNGLNAGLMTGFKDVKSNVSGMAGAIANSFGSTNLAYSMTPITSGFDLNDNGTVSMSLENNKQPAQLNLAMGQNTYSAYVDDISNQQGKSYDLRKNNAVSVY